jgi:predicted SnoaL-like aldol condensation-catalyzing enzyme
MRPKLSNAISLYVDGVRDGHVIAAAEKYVSETLIQHTRGMAQGREGLVAAFEPLIERHERRMVRPLRGFEDGSRVFLHTFQTYGYRAVERVGIDVFDTDDDDHLTEHWSVCTPLRSWSRAGYSQIDGPGRPDEHADTVASRQLVRAFLDDVLVRGHWDRVRRYLCRTDFAQHDPDIAAGASGFAHHLYEMASAGTPIVYREVGPIIGSGDFVVSFSRITVGDRGHDAFDVFRVAGDRIVEHWDCVSA